MNQYYVFEIQEITEGSYSYLIHSATDDDPAIARLKGESTYHSVLASAAISSIPSHTAVLLNAEGVLIMSQCYKHPTEEVEEY